jgi:hypothetical protein
MRPLSAARSAHVFVIDGERREWEGKLLEVASSTLAIEESGSVRRFPLASVRRVDRQGDSIKDGAIKGAVAGLLIGLTLQRADVRGMISLGLLGAGIDALHSHKNTIYRGQAATVQVPIVRW